MKRTAVAILFLTLLMLAACSGKENEMQKLSFHSFDGGGPEYTAVVADPEIVSVSSSKRYNSIFHSFLTGSGFDVTFTFKGLKPGETTVTIEERSPLTGNTDIVYSVKVDKAGVTLEKLTETDLDAAEPTAVLVIDTGKGAIYADLSENASADALVSRLNSGPITVELSDSAGCEKLGGLPWELPSSPSSASAVPGSIALIGGNGLAIVYAPTDLEFTPLASVSGISAESLLELLGPGSITVTLSLEWSE